MPSAFLPPEKPASLQARGLKWRRRAKHWVAYWVARVDLVDAGYPLEAQRLWPPSEPDTPRLPTPDEWNHIAWECERLQDEMLVWSKGEAATNPLVLFDGTLGSLIRVYQIDRDSPYHAVRYGVRLKYDSHLRILTRAVGKARLSALSFRDFKRWYEGFRGDTKDAGGRTVSVGAMVPRAAALMAMLRTVVSFGKLAKLPHCAELRGVLSEMDFPAGRPRTQFITAEQAIAIRKAAHATGRPSIALAEALLFELGLRPCDVIGEWLPVSEPGLSAVTCHGKKWMMGIDWRELSPDLVLRHRLSKSVRGRNAVADPNAGKIEEYDLREYPMVIEELAHIPDAARSGPLVKNETTGLPWRAQKFRQAWRRIARTAGVPDTVQNRDNRAGSVTEADAVAEGNEAQTHLAHEHPEMTERYIRERREKRTKLQRKRVRNRMGNGGERGA